MFLFKKKNEIKIDKEDIIEDQEDSMALTRPIFEHFGYKDCLHIEKKHLVAEFVGKPIQKKVYFDIRRVGIYLKPISNQNKTQKYQVYLLKSSPLLNKERESKNNSLINP